MLPRTRLLLYEITYSPKSFDKKAFRGGSRNKDTSTTLFKRKKNPWEDGPQVKTKGFGDPHNADKKNVTRAGAPLKINGAPTRLRYLKPAVVNPDDDRSFVDGKS